MNILLNNDNSSTPKVKITDFGLAAKIGDNCLTTKVVGTCGFMAPEVISGEASDYKADVWGLASILYALICGEVPFAATSLEETLQKTVTLPLTFEGEAWEQTSQECKDLLTAMMEKDQSARMSLNEVFEHEWVTQR